MDELHDNVLLELHDDVLLEVLQYLDVPDLLACRLVCKRLGSLVLDGRVWRHRDLRLNGHLPNGRFCRTASAREPGRIHLLGRAPCLDHLYVYTAASTLRTLTTVQCAVASLTLEEGNLRFDPASAALYAELVLHQEALGRLRRVHLILHSDNACSVLLPMLATLPRLESVICTSRRSRTPICSDLVPSLPVQSASSLRKFSWQLTKYSWSLVRTVLAVHGSNLEDVELQVVSKGWYSWTDPGDTLASLLAALPKLHSLRLDHPSLPGLAAVAACGTLRKLRLDSGEEKEMSSTVVELLRRAKQLRDVSLQLDWPGPGCEVLDALASPALERLELTLVGEPGARPLLRALPTLPALRHLVLAGGHLSSLTDAVARDLLLGVTPATAPELRILELKVGRHPCPHSWMHVTEVDTALFANPSLHLQLEVLGAQRCRQKSCVACFNNCHKDFFKEGVGVFDSLKVAIHLDELQLVVKSSVLKSRKK